MLKEKKIRHLIPWRRLWGRKIPSEVLRVNNRIQVDDPKHKKVVFGRLRAMVEGFISKLKNRLAYDQFTWRGLKNAGIHTSLAFCVIYAVAIAALKLGRPDLMGSISYFA